MKNNSFKRESSLNKIVIKLRCAFRENLKRHMKQARATSSRLKSGNLMNGRELRMSADLVVKTPASRFLS